jgi:hypothetical protein
MTPTKESVGGEKTAMSESFAPMPDIDIAEHLHNVRQAGLDTSLIPGYKDLSRQLRAVLDDVLAVYPEEDRIEIEDRLLKPLVDRQELMLSVFYRRGLMDGIKLMVNL